jgi:hypothetical protein
VNRSLVITRPVRPPKELQTFFDNLPLIGSERPQDYHAFFSAIASAELPSDAIDWLLLKDLVDLAWEIRRERRIKVGIVKLHQLAVICDLLKSSFSKPSKLDSAINRIFLAPTEARLWASDPEARKRIDLQLKEKGHDPESVLAEAYLRGARDIDAIDKRIALYEIRRNAALREIAQRSELKAERLDQVSSDEPSLPKRRNKFDVLRSEDRRQPKQCEKKHRTAVGGWPRRFAPQCAAARSGHCYPERCSLCGRCGAAGTGDIAV